MTGYQFHYHFHQMTIDLSQLNLCSLANSPKKETFVLLSLLHLLIRSLVGSCGSVWASETVKLRHLYPEVYEVCSIGQNHTRPLKQVHARIIDSVRLFMLMTEYKDLLKVSNNLSCRYRAYELQGVRHLSK